MKKLAIFAEGLTEATFLRRLLEEVAGRHRLVFEMRRQFRGRLQLLSAADAVTHETRCFVLIVNCANDERVKTEILNQRATLIREKYDLVIGLRDLHPNTFADLPKVEANLMYGVPTKELTIQMFLAVAEVEAWFIQEHTHFVRIHPELTPEEILRLKGFDVRVERADTLAAPAQFLDDVYSSRQLRYQKTGNQISRTVNAIDYALLYIDTAPRVPHLRRLVNAVDTFLPTT